MSIAYVTDGVTDLDSALFNPIIDRVNGDAGPLGNMRLGIYNVLTQTVRWRMAVPISRRSPKPPSTRRNSLGAEPSRFPAAPI
jgi:hypothetical protein